MVVLVGPNGKPPSELRQQHTTAIAAAKAAGKQVLCVLADGVISTATAEQLSAPLISQYLDLGSMVVLPLNLLIAGPPGIALLSKNSIKDAKQHLEASGRSLSTAGVATAASAIQMSASPENSEASSSSFLAATLENLENRAKRMAIQLSGVGVIEEAEARQTTQPLGPAPWDCYKMDSWSIHLTGNTKQIQELAHASSPIVHLAQLGDVLCIDLRFVDAADDYQIVDAFAGKED